MPENHQILVEAIAEVNSNIVVVMGKLPVGLVTVTFEMINNKIR
jgi:hypothetical protein